MEARMTLKEFFADVDALFNGANNPRLNTTARTHAMKHLVSVYGDEPPGLALEYIRAVYTANGSANKDTRSGGRRQ
jgi:hypothetical protein